MNCGRRQASIARVTARARDYYERQRRTCRDAILPFIESVRGVSPGARVMEIGCGEGGVLTEFIERGCSCVGIERSEGRVAFAREFLAAPLALGQVKFLASDVHDLVGDPAFRGAFDVIVLKDVIEHIHDQERLIRALAGLLSPAGVAFFGFPPWGMPFGGHQQVCRSRILSKAPYVHLLSRAAYARLLRAFGETEGKIDGLLEIVDTGISTRRFEAIVEAAGFHVLARRLYLVSPNYRPRFGIRPVGQLAMVTAFERLRDHVSSAAYYAIRPGQA